MSAAKIIWPVAGILVVSAVWWVLVDSSPEDGSRTTEEGAPLPARQTRQPVTIGQSGGLAYRKRDRSLDPGEKTAAARAMADELIRLSIADEDGTNRSGMTLELMEELARFDSQQLQDVLSHVTASADLSPVSKPEACGFLLPVLGLIDPMKALDLRLSLQPVFQDRDDILPVAKLLESVAARDPSVAAEWRLKHQPGSE